MIVKILFTRLQQPERLDNAREGAKEFTPYLFSSPEKCEGSSIKPPLYNLPYSYNSIMDVFKYT